MTNEITIKINQEEAEAIARIFALIKVNTMINPDSYDKSQIMLLENVFDAIDYQIHEVAKWCDKTDCNYYKKKKEREERLENAN